MSLTIRLMDGPTTGEIVDVYVPNSVIGRKEGSLPKAGRWTVRPVEYVETVRNGEWFNVPTISFYGVRLVIGRHCMPSAPCSWLAWRRLDLAWAYLLRQEREIRDDIRLRVEAGAGVESATFDATRALYPKE